MAELLGSLMGDQINSFSSQSNVPEKILKARAEKDRGNELFQKGEHKEALAAYHYAKLTVKGLVNLKPEEQEQIKAIELSCHLNMAAVYIKFGWWQKAANVATLVLETDSSNIKALFRRGKAYLELNYTEKARADLIQAIKLAPSDKALRDEYARLQEREKLLAQQQKQVFKNIFENDLSDE